MIGLQIGESVAEPDGNIAWPIVVADGDDVMIFDDLNAFQGKIEPVDAAQDVFDAFDSTGRLLRVHALNDMADVALSQPPVDASAQCEALLLRVLPELTLRTQPLAALIARAKQLGHRRSC